MQPQTAPQQLQFGHFNPAQFQVGPPELEARLQRIEKVALEAHDRAFNHGHSGMKSVLGKLVENVTELGEDVKLLKNIVPLVKAAEGQYKAYQRESQRIEQHFLRIGYPMPSVAAEGGPGYPVHPGAQVPGHFGGPPGAYPLPSFPPPAAPSYPPPAPPSFPPPHPSMQPPVPAPPAAALAPEEDSDMMGWLQQLEAAKGEGTAVTHPVQELQEPAAPITVTVPAAPTVAPVLSDNTRSSQRVPEPKLDKGGDVQDFFRKMHIFFTLAGTCFAQHHIPSCSPAMDCSY